MKAFNLSTAVFCFGMGIMVKDDSKIAAFINFTLSAINVYAAFS